MTSTSAAAADDALDDLVHRADLDGLIRLVDERSATADWSGLRRARDRARSAVGTGRQLWPVATLAEYRLALLAPPEWAAPMIADDTGLFAIGPLTEVIAQHHTWASLTDALPDGPRAAVVAHERVLRGDVIDHPSTVALPVVLDMPFALAEWEPTYALAAYTDNGVDVDAPGVPSTVRSEPFRRSGDGPGTIDDRSVALAVRQLVESWTADSNGRVDVVAVEGTAERAVTALGVERGTAVEIDLAAALAWLAWAGASGGAHGRRRGAALGRFGALWTLATLLDVDDEWPVPPEELGEMASELRWLWWDAGEPATGWRLQLAVEDRRHALAWAVSARDDT